MTDFRIADTFTRSRAVTGVQQFFVFQSEDGSNCIDVMHGENQLSGFSIQLPM